MTTWARGDLCWFLSVCAWVTRAYAIHQVPDERGGKGCGERLAWDRQEQPMVAGPPELVDDDLEVNAGPDLTLVLGDGEPAGGQLAAGPDIAF